MEATPSNLTKVMRDKANREEQIAPDKSGSAVLEGEVIKFKTKVGEGKPFPIYYSMDIMQSKSKTKLDVDKKKIVLIANWANRANMKLMVLSHTLRLQLASAAVTANKTYK